MGKVWRVALRPLYDMVMKGGGGIDERARWALEWWLRLLPELAPRLTIPIGRAVDVGIYSGAFTTDGGMAAVALFPRQADEFTVLLKGNAEPLLLGSISDTYEISAWRCLRWSQQQRPWARS